MRVDKQRVIPLRTQFDPISIPLFMIARIFPARSFNCSLLGRVEPPITRFGAQLVKQILNIPRHEFVVGEADFTIRSAGLRRDEEDGFP